MPIMSALFAVGLWLPDATFTPPRAFDLACQGRAFDVYDVTVWEDFRWEGRLDLDAQEVQTRDGRKPDVLRIRDDGRLSWGARNFDRDSGRLVDETGGARIQATAQCRETPVF